ncbi:hypothetical protein AYO40_05025 [Planctomycetaceae bacterium SCGC AG-212-D15]|nr:hypothetical protein AYO40_05025 [Planctomycetaceae bacterium SCGC AG-212-D15]
MTKTVAVLQSNYLPWKGYFDIIHDVDLFIFYDDVQYTTNDWRNRNVVKTPNHLAWLTVPVGNQNHRLVCDVELKDDRWQAKHWRTIAQSYSRAPCFQEVSPFLQEALLGRSWSNLSMLNQHLTTTIARRFLNISTAFDDSRRYVLHGKRQERLLDLLSQTAARRYISGPAAAKYIDPDSFRAAGIELIYKDYSGYPIYPQFHPPFEHCVSVIDLLMHTGSAAPDYIWKWRDASRRKAA